jgi:hypothetical protein
MWQEDLAEELKSAQAPSDRRRIIGTYKERTGHSEQHLYRIARTHGFESGRAKRSDTGILKTGLSNGQIDFVAALMYETGRENKGPIMPVERAIQIAVDSGYLEPGQVAPATMNRLLRERNMSKAHMKAPTPHTHMRSLHPNHVHTFDVSVCIQYYLKNGRLGIMDERDFYKNKLENYAKIKTKMLRYVIVDHFSGAFYFRYFGASGESADNLWAFLKEAWALKADERLPFRGVPFHLLMDTGAANKSKAIVNFLERLGVNIPKGRPYNPRRQGGGEVHHDIIEEWFESSLRLQPAASIEDINAWAMDMMIWFQSNKIHTRHGMTRTACWLLITKDQLRELPPDDILQDLYARPEEDRTVENSEISFRGKPYNLRHIDGLFNGAKVKVILRPHKWPVVDVSWQETLYEVEPAENLPGTLGGFRADAAIIGETYRAEPETNTQRAIKRFDNMAYGEEKKKGDVPFEGLRVFGHHADKVDVAFIGRRGTPIEIDRNISREIPLGQFLKRLKEAIGVISPELNQELRRHYGSTIDISQGEEVIKAIQEGTWADESCRVMESAG